MKLPNTFFDLYLNQKNLLVKKLEIIDDAIDNFGDLIYFDIGMHCHIDDIETTEFEQHLEEVTAVLYLNHKNYYDFNSSKHDDSVWENEKIYHEIYKEEDYNDMWYCSIFDNPNYFFKIVE